MDKVLIIGYYSREHAMGWSIAKSDNVSEVLFAPGNAGTEEGKCRNIPIDGTKKENFRMLADFIEAEKVGLVVVGPDKPLAEGVVDYLKSKTGCRVFGCTKAASQLEWDKFLSYDIMESLGIPQANSVKCYTTEEAIKAIKERATKDGIVIKARGLTAGKGVSVCDSKEQALLEIIRHANEYGSEVLIAERFFGQEFSIFGISNGNWVLPFEIAFQDKKRLLDRDKGPNTGGMGAYGPVPVAPIGVVRYVAESIMTPVVQEMKRRGAEYQGFMYAGMIMTKEGPKVLEFNARFGDPEAQPAMMMLRQSLYEPLALTLEEKLDEAKIELKPGAACCVVLATQAYPGKQKEALPISGLEDAAKIDGVKVFHYRTKRQNNVVLTSDGRVLGVTGYSDKGIQDASVLTYTASKKLTIPGDFRYRTDLTESVSE